jgi:hypothetical protein
MKILQILLMALTVILLFQPVSAQVEPDSTIYNIETTDGNEYVGMIVDKDNMSVLLKTELLGEISIPLSGIKRIKQISSSRLIKGQYWFENPQSARYFWAPNGYGLKKGEGYYQNVWIFFNQMSVGVTDNFSMGGGIVPLFIFGGAPTPVYITPKFSIPVVENKFNIGLGALGVTVVGEEDASAALLYGTTTFGSKDRNISVGLGYGYASGQWSNGPAINISGMVRTGPRGYFITENYYIGLGGDAAGIISLGGRSIIKRVSLDYGGFIPIVESDTFIMIPWLGITVPLNKKSFVPAVDF